MNPPMDARATSLGRGGAGAHRRARSLSRFPPPTPGSDEFETPRGRFVNKARGSGQVLFSDTGEVSLDDLADEFLRARAESEEDEVVLVRRGRDDRRMSFHRGKIGSGSSSRYLRETESSKQRGRSVSRPPAVGRNQSVGPTKTRYSSVVDRRRGTRSNYESEQAVPQGGNPKFTNKKPAMGGIRNLVQKQPNLNYGIRRSMSQKDFFLSHDSSSTHSSLTDDDARDVRFTDVNRSEKTIREVYYPEKEHSGSDKETGLYEAMRKEVRSAVEEIRTQLEKVVGKTESPDRTGTDDLKPVQVIAELRRNYSSKLEESENRKQELLAELAAEEQRGQELTKIVKELLPSPQSNKLTGRQSRARRRSKERNRVSRHLTEEAERYFEDFLSNVDDTDFSSFDEERSETSSCRKETLLNHNTSSTLIELQETPVTKSSPVPSETDGVVLPWLQWETSLQTSPLKPKPEVRSSKSLDTVASSHASWSPEYGSGSDASVCRSKSINNLGEMKKYNDNGLAVKIKGSSYSKDEYLDLRNKEDFLQERLRQRKRIESGRLILCERIML
ncbi:hypothetical protein LUZ62_050443 [Rhynchospora pubera]|uniref:Spindle pole body-associated protein cut12 domain-containing protein n=1 Tax=Rhynchospora pubera TaxID=906938 RepID=A0AAV8G7I1_9POAL|nr:hypothetical protein LUZ62_050443 [Rhynchospora pubera]